MMIIENGKMLVDPQMVMVGAPKKEETVTIPLAEYRRLVEQDFRVKATHEFIKVGDYVDAKPIRALLGCPQPEKKEN